MQHITVDCGLLRQKRRSMPNGAARGRTARSRAVPDPVEHSLLLILHLAQLHVDGMSSSIAERLPFAVFIIDEL